MSEIESLQLYNNFIESALSFEEVFRLFVADRVDDSSRQNPCVLLYTSLTTGAYRK